MSDFAQTLVNGLLLGGLLGLASLGFSLVWGVMGVLNIAHGTLVIIGSYLAYFFLNSAAGVDPFLTLPLVVAIMFVVGYSIQLAGMSRIIRGDLLITLSFTFGLDLVLMNAVLLVYDSDIRSTSSRFPGASLEFGDIIVPQTRLFIFAAAVLLAVICHLFLVHTRYGRAIRATGMDRDAARLSGISIERVYAWTFGVAAAIAGAAGVLTSMVMPFTPFLGDRFLNNAFVVTVLGGLGNVFGAVLGGMILGITQTFAATYVGAGYSDAIGFLVFVLVLVFRPQGLFGTRFSA
jgi:branched-chain amino acid transport system permease protein